MNTRWKTTIEAHGKIITPSYETIRCSATLETIYRITKRPISLFTQADGQLHLKGVPADYTKKSLNSAGS